MFRIVFLLVSFVYAQAFSRLCGIRFRSFANRAFVDDTIDVSPQNDGSVLKRVLRAGDVTKGQPQQKDIVEIAWKVFSKSDGSLLHDSRTMLGKPVPGYTDEGRISSSSNATSTSNNEGSDGSSNSSDYTGWKFFTYEVGATPRQVIQGWEVSVPGMYEGEIAHLEIASHMAFGEKGVPPFIPANEDIVCELELVKILPNWRKTVRKAGEDEHLREELIRKIQSGELPIADQLKHRNPSPAQQSADSTVSSSSSSSSGSGSGSGSSSGESLRRDQRKDRKFFEESKHRVDPKLRVDGRAEGYRWSEDASSLEIEIPIKDDTVTKSDLSIQMYPDRIDIAIRGRQQQPLLRGPLHGRILPSECMWALLKEQRDGTAGTQAVLQLSLEKSHGHREVWATVLDRGFLAQQQQQQQQQQLEPEASSINSSGGECLESDAVGSSVDESTNGDAFDGGDVEILQ